ncbi:hypothetical protein RDI58_019960 [Solanum bulbocastanum]|uniref:Uncharacterized protein n=1 Tax=Solanum bulbocastanum TaxID=147425 RepID=A0AAN8T938_SOLBU
MYYFHTYTFEQRRKNLIIKDTSRPGGSIIDYVYHHLQTKRNQFLVEVYNFMVYGEVLETKKKLSQSEEALQRPGAESYNEAQRRLKIDEELRLDELRACVGGASSNLVPTKVGLISGVNVVMESLNLTTTPPCSKGTLEVLLSASATIGTTIHVLGDIKASFPDSKA